MGPGRKSTWALRVVGGASASVHWPFGHMALGGLGVCVCVGLGCVFLLRRWGDIGEAQTASTAIFFEAKAWLHS